VTLSALLALVSAATFGAADFMGGLAARRAGTIAAVVVSQIAGVFLLFAMLPFLPRTHVMPADVAWGAAAGLAGGVGLALLYRALALGTMSVVAPVTALCAAGVPVAAGLALGDRLTTMTSGGIALAAAAIVLIGQAEDTPSEAGLTPVSAAHDPARALRIALASGVAIGFFLVALERTGSEAGMWPLVAARAVSISMFCALGAATRQPLLLRGRVAAIAIVGGCIDMVANVLYLVAVRAGQLSVVATLTSLYPASTVVLARVVLDERLSKRQTAGIVAAIIATLLIVGGSE